MESKHREEILSLLTETDNMFLREMCCRFYDAEKNTWKIFNKDECNLGPFYDHEGIISNLIRAGIIIHEYGYPYGMSWFSINPEYRTLLRKHHDI